MGYFSPKLANRDGNNRHQSKQHHRRTKHIFQFGNNPVVSSINSNIKGFPPSLASLGLWGLDEGDYMIKLTVKTMEDSNIAVSTQVQFLF